MPYYQDLPNRRASAKNNPDNWKEERSARGGRSGSRAGNRPYSGPRRRDEEKNDYRSFDDGRRPDRRDSRPDRRSTGTRPPRRFGPERPEDRDRRTQPREAAPRGHEAFEYHRPEPTAPAPREIHRAEREETLPENLLLGRNPIREALKTGRDLEKLLVMKGELSGSARQIVQMAKEARIPVQEVDKSRLDEITPHHQGLIAFASAYSYSTVEDMFAVAQERDEEPFLIILDGVTDPQNLGAIIRSAECVGAHGVIVRERRSVGLTPAAVKASAGAIEHVKVARVTNLNRTIEELKRRGVWVYALTMDGEDYQKVAFDGAVALVIGSEGEGISHLTLEECDHKVSLPLMGQIESLNASVAAGVMMYRVLACRKP